MLVSKDGIGASAVDVPMNAAPPDWLRVYQSAK